MLVLSEASASIQHTGAMSAFQKDSNVEIQHPSTVSTFRFQFQIQLLSPDFPFQEFPLTEVVTQSQIDSSSISDMLDPRETSNSSKESHQQYRFTLEIQLEQQITQRNE